MKRLLAAALFSAAVLCAASADRPRVTRAEVANVEKLINTQLASMFPDEPWLLLGYTRGFYVEGTGVVFSAEINLATGPTISPFSQPPTKEIILAHHAKKVQRVPKLRETMYSVLKSLGSIVSIHAAGRATHPGRHHPALPVGKRRRSSEPGGDACAARKTQRCARQE